MILAVAKTEGGAATAFFAAPGRLRGPGRVFVMGVSILSVSFLEKISLVPLSPPPPGPGGAMVIDGVGGGEETLFRLGYE